MTRRGQFNLAVLAAFLIAALMPALIISALSNWMAVYESYVFTLIYVLFFGTPIFAILASKRCVNIFSCVFGAALVAALAPAIFALLSWLGWQGYIALVGMSSAFGASAGFTFWLVLKLSGNLPAANGDYNPEAKVKPYSGIGVLVVAIVAVGAVCSMPWLLRDRSCHNLFRDGATYASPMVSMELDVSVPDWPTLRALFARFGAAQGLLLKDVSEARPGVVDILSVDICNNQGTNISADWQVWKGQPAVAGITGTPLRIYQVRNDPRWKEIARDFIAEVNAAWPGKLTFKDSKGNKTATLPNILAPSSSAPPSKPAGK